MEILFVDLNMKALNSLIWASAVLAKLGIVALIVGGILWAIVLILAVVGD